MRKARSLAEMLLLRFILPPEEADGTYAAVEGDKDVCLTGLPPGTNGLETSGSESLGASGGEDVGVSSCGEVLTVPSGETRGDM